MSKKEMKTNACRILDRLKIPYEMTTYECEEFMDGITVADLLGVSHSIMYKTLVTTGKSQTHYVFVIPIEAELDFKKAAKVIGEKSLEMLPLKDLTEITGYIRGGCTCIGMKKQFATFFQEEAAKLSKIVVSGGKRGLQISLLPNALLSAAGAEFTDVIWQPSLFRRSL